MIYICWELLIFVFGLNRWAPDTTCSVHFDEVLIRILFCLCLYETYVFIVKKKNHCTPWWWNSYCRDRTEIRRGEDLFFIDSVYRWLDGDEGLSWVKFNSEVKELGKNLSASGSVHNIIRSWRIFAEEIYGVYRCRSLYL